MVTCAAIVGETMTTRFEVQTNTLCQGWVNCWSIDDKPETFPTVEAAQAAIVEYENERLQEGLDNDDELRVAEVQA